jgi:hypothetical protein
MRCGGVNTAEGWALAMNASVEHDLAELKVASVNDDLAVTTSDESLVAAEELVDLDSPMRHFHRALKARSLSTGPLANPRRTRLV